MLRHLEEFAVTFVNIILDILIVKFLNKIWDNLAYVLNCIIIEFKKL